MNFTHKGLSLVLFLLALSVAFALYFTLNNLRERDPIAAQGSPVTVSFTGGNARTVAEGAMVTLTVELSAAATQAVNIPITIQDTPGSDGDSPVIDQDYTLTGDNYAAGVLRFPAGSQSQDLVFMALNDDVDDDNEIVTLGFGVLPPGVNMASSNVSISVTITDDPDDVPALFLDVVSVVHAHETDRRGLAILSLTDVDGTSTAPERPVQITITVGDASTASPGDYTLIPPLTVDFSADFTDVKNVFVDPMDDNDVESTETVVLIFSFDDLRITSRIPVNGITINIEDNDAPPPPSIPPIDVYFESASGGIPNVDEGQELEIATINLERDPMRTVAIDIGTAGIPGSDSGNTGQGVVQIGTDYTITPTMVVFSPGETSKPLSFMAIDDSFDDDGESVEISFMNLPEGITRTAAREDTLTVNIVDDDDPAVTLSFSAPTYDATEGRAGATVAVTADVVPEREIDIAVTPSGDVSDFQVDGRPLSATPISGSIAADQRTFMFTLEAIDDSIDDDGNSVNLALSLPTSTSGVSIGSLNNAAVNIIDDDVIVPVVVSFEVPSSGSYTVEEGAVQEITINLDQDPMRTVAINIGMSGIRGSDYMNAGQDLVEIRTDYTITPTTVIFTPGETSKPLTFMAIDDSFDDDGEMVEFSFADPLQEGVTRAEVGSGDTFTVNIQDNDRPDDLTVQFERAIYEVDEGSSEDIVLTLSDFPDSVICVPITITGQGGGSFDDLTITDAGLIQRDCLEFSANEVEKSFTVRANPDNVDDNDESALFGFGDLTVVPGLSAGAQDSAVLNIGDTDHRVSFGASDYTVAEAEVGDTVLTVTVELANAPGRTVAIPIVVTPGEDTEVTVGDTSVTSGTRISLSFGRSETSKNVLVRVREETDDFTDQLVTLSLSENQPDEVEIVEPGTAEVRFLDKDLNDLPLRAGTIKDPSGGDLVEGVARPQLVLLGNIPPVTDGAQSNAHKWARGTVSFVMWPNLREASRGQEGGLPVEPFGIDFADGTLWDITPQDADGEEITGTFEVSVRVCVPVTEDARSGSGGSLSSLRMYRYDPDEGGTRWELVDGTGLSQSGDRICGDVMEFSFFVLGFDRDLNDLLLRAGTIKDPSGGDLVEGVARPQLVLLGNTPPVNDDGAQSNAHKLARGTVSFVMWPNLREASRGQEGGLPVEPFGVDFADGTLWDITPQDADGEEITGTFEVSVRVCVPVTEDARSGSGGSLSSLRMYRYDPEEGGTRWELVEDTELSQSGDRICGDVMEFSFFVLGFSEPEEESSSRSRLLPPTGGIALSYGWLFGLFSLGAVLVLSGGLWLAVSRRWAFSSSR